MHATLGFSRILPSPGDRRTHETAWRLKRSQEGVLFLEAQRSSRLLFRLLQGAGAGEFVSRIAESPLTTSLTKS
jgi:hypothetical protein